MGLRYWTALYIGGDSAARDFYCYSRRDSIQSAFSTGEPASLNSHGIKVSEIAMHEEPTAIVLIAPTQQDLTNLGNAAIIKLADFKYGPEGYPRSVAEDLLRDCFIAIRPQDFDSDKVAMLRSKQLKRPYANPSWDANSVLDFTIIKGGSVFSGSMCESCDKVIGRAAGRCVPGGKMCVGKLFSPGSVITMPTEELYIPLNKCASPDPFRPVSYISIDAALTPDTIGTRPPSAEVARATKTKKLRTYVCRHCALSSPVSSKSAYSKCGSKDCKPSTRHSLGCSGPIFEGNFSEPSYEERTAIRLGAVHLDVSDLRSLVEDYGEVGRGHRIPNWRIDPELRVGLQLNPGTITVVQTRVSKPRNMWNFRFADVCDYLNKHNRNVTVPDKPASFMEKFVIRMLQNNIHEYFHLSTGTWGSATGILASAYLHTISDTKEGFSFLFMFPSFSATEYISSLPSLAELFYMSPSILSHDYSDGKPTLNDILIQSTIEGNGKKVRKFTEGVNEICAAGKPIPQLPENFSTDPIPSDSFVIPLL